MNGLKPLLVVSGLSRKLILGLTAILFTGCTVADENDYCCAVRLYFRYILNSENRFQKDIYSMRHFLFDGNGVFMYEVFNYYEKMEELTITDLREGRYTLITLGNATVNTQLSALTPGETTLSTFSQAVNSRQQDGCRTNGDQLFYNARTFKATLSNTDNYICDLSNIHCHLHVQATWDYSPSYSDSFTMRLYEVPATYTLSPDSTRRILQQYDDPQLMESTTNNIVQLFPRQPQTLTSHLVSILPFNFQLEGEFVTERYTNQWAPVLQIYNGEQPITGRINLDRAFTFFGWYPDSDPAQDYWIKLVIHRDGSVNLDRWMRGSVADWIDGGVITN